MINKVSFLVQRHRAIFTSFLDILLGFTFCISSDLNLYAVTSLRRAVAPCVSVVIIQ